MAKKEDKKSKPESKTPELTKAKKALDAYLKENKLDPTKDWTKDKKHGKKITELVNKLNKERDKVAAAYPEKDADNNKKLVKLKKKKEKEKSGKKEEKKEKKSAGRTATKYDYPLIDGQEMTSAEKKKYRMEQRKLASGNAPKKEKEAKKAKKEKVKEKPASNKKEKKADKKKDKKKKKAAKEED